jgi:hypothetical protein
MLKEERPGHERIIEQWMLTVLSDGGIDRFDDLHIDTIDAIWRSRSFWVEGGLAAFRLALRLRDRHSIPVKVELAFSLKTNDRRTGADFDTLEQFALRLDWTPPSLYLFRTGGEHGLANKNQACENMLIEELNLNLFGVLKIGERCFYLEFDRGKEAEFYRSVVLQG